MRVMTDKSELCDSRGALVIASDVERASIRAARTLAILFPPGFFAWLEWIREGLHALAEDDGLYLVIAADNCALVTGYELEIDGYRIWGRIR